MAEPNLPSELLINGQPLPVIWVDIGEYLFSEYPDLGNMQVFMPLTRWATLTPQIMEFLYQNIYMLNYATGEFRQFTPEEQGSRLTDVKTREKAVLSPDNFSRELVYQTLVNEALWAGLPEKILSIPMLKSLFVDLANRPDVAMGRKDTLPRLLNQIQGFQQFAPNWELLAAPKGLAPIPEQRTTAPPTKGRILTPEDITPETRLQPEDIVVAPDQQTALALGASQWIPTESFPGLRERREIARASKEGAPIEKMSPLEFYKYGIDMGELESFYFPEDTEQEARWRVLTHSGLVEQPFAQGQGWTTGLSETKLAEQGLLPQSRLVGTTPPTDLEKEWRKLVKESSRAQRVIKI